MRRLLDVISTRFAENSFDSRDVWNAYRETWGDDFTLGAVSTYLARLADRGTLERTGSPAHWFYKLRPSPTNLWSQSITPDLLFLVILTDTTSDCIRAARPGRRAEAAAPVAPTGRPDLC